MLLAGHVGANWLWRSANVIVLGFDRTFHLVNSQVYDHILRADALPRALFSALTWSDYYPPLVHLSIAGFYRLFGVSADVAAMVNVVYLALLLLGVYGIGERLAGPWPGLLAAAIVSLLPMVFSMSRYTYLDFPLAALVAINVCLLLRSNCFARRGYALLYGLSLGLGLLIKWTFVVFAGGPLLAVLLSRGAPGEAPLAGAWQAVRSAVTARLGGGRLPVIGCAALLGLAVTAAWYLPNRAPTAALLLGNWLVLLSWLLWTWTWTFILIPRRRPGSPPGDEAGLGRGANLLAALGLGACLAGSWYLTRIEFVGTFWLNAYGKDSGRSWGFSEYGQLLWTEQLGPVLAGLVVAALAGLAIARWQRVSGSVRAFLALGVDGWALVLWAALSFVVFSAQVSIIHSRYILPLLPPLGIALALALAWRPDSLRANRGLAHLSRLRLGAIAAVLGFALLQFVVLSFDGLDRLRAAPVFAEGYFIQQPASSRTDAGYWVVPDVLDYVEAHRDTDPGRLGILVNTQQVNSKHFIYEVYAGYPHIQIQELAEMGRGKGLYGRLFESDFLLLIDPPPDYVRRPEARETLERILQDQDDTFHQAYSLAQTYPLPDGTRLLLYERRLERQTDVDLAPYEALMADLATRAQAGDVLVVSPPEMIYSLARFGDGTLPLVPLPADAGPAQLGEGYSRLWLATTGDGGELRRSLDENAYPAGQTWHGPLQLVLYGSPDMAGEPVWHETPGVQWADRVGLAAYALSDDTVPLGQIARLAVRWQPVGEIDEPYKMFLHLVDRQGALAGQTDAEPAAGRPTSTWDEAPDVIVTGRHGLLLPADLAPGEYRLLIGLYPAAGGDRLPVCCPAGDAFILAEVHVENGLADIHTLP